MAEFDESKVINALHTDKAEIGKKYWVSDELVDLKEEVEKSKTPFELKGVNKGYNGLSYTEFREEGYKKGHAEGRKKCMTVQNAMETIKKYCKEITDENNNCSKCIFCSKGFNGCKLQRAPCDWE